MANDYISQVTLPNNVTYDFKDQNLKLYTGSCTTAADIAIKDVITDGAFTLAKGAVVFVNFSVTNTAAVANLKLKFNGEADANAKPIKYLVNSNDPANIPGTGYLRANQTYMFQYDGTNWVVSLNYYTYSNNFASMVGHYNNILARKAITAESLIVGDSTGYEKVASGVTFDLAYPIVWCTANVAINTSNYANMYLQHYDRNIATGAKSGFTSAANKAIYLIVTINGNIATVDANIITDTLPSSEDGKVYIVLGKLGAQSTGANYFFLYPTHPMFWYKDGAIREYGGGSGIKNITRSGTTFTVTRDDGTTFTFTQQDNNTTYTFANGTNGFTVTPSGGTAQTVTVTPSITNNITGTGTANYLTKFTGANTIGNSGLTTDTNNNLTIPGTIYFSSNTSTSTGKALFAYNSTYPKFGIWYKEGDPDVMAFSASGNGDSTTNADFAVQGGGKLYNKGNIIPNTGNTSGNVGNSTKTIYVEGGIIKEGTTLGTAATHAHGDYALAGHTHSYLPLSGGTMNGTARISWADSGSWGTEGATFPNKRGGLYWTGTSDWIDLFAEETSSDKLNLVINFGDDANPSLVLRDRGTDKITMTPGSGLISATSFSGSGANLTSLNASNISSGTISLDRLPTITNAKLSNSKVTIAGNDVSLGGSLAANTLVSSLGLSKAMRFIGIATVAITDGSTTDPVISNYSTKTAGDVIIDKDSSREYVWSTAGKWELLGGDSSYKTTQSAVDSGAAATNKWVSRIQQNANGVITATMGTLDTSGTWSGNATTATTATNLSTAPTIVAGGTSTINLSANTAYTLTVGGKSVIFKTPTDGNTDTKVNVTLGATTKAYLLGTSTTPTSTAAGVTAIADTGVYLDTTAGKLTANTFNGNYIVANGEKGSSIANIKFYTGAANAGKTYIGWIKIASIDMGNNNYWGDKIYDIYLDRTYNSPSSEVYAIRVCVGWGSSNIIQLGGKYGNQIINKFRIVRNNTTHTAYLEYYVNTNYTTYQNTVNIRAIGYHGAELTLLNEIQSEAEDTFASKEELTLSDGIVGNLTGNAATATTATNLANNPSIQTSGTTQVTITAGGKTSNAYTVPYATNSDTVDNLHADDFFKKERDWLAYSVTLTANVWKRILKVTTSTGSTFLITVNTHHSGHINTVTWLITSNLSQNITITELTGTQHSSGLKIRISSDSTYITPAYVDLQKTSTSATSASFSIKIIRLDSSSVFEIQDTDNVSALTYSKEVTVNETRILSKDTTYAANSDGTAVYIARDRETTIATINGTAVKIKIPASDNTNTTYTFANGNGGFTVTPSGGSAQTVSIGKPSTAGTSDKATAANLTTTTNALAYYTNTTGTFGNASKITVYNNVDITVQNATKKRNGLAIIGACYGNTATDLTSNTAGVMRYEDGGPRIDFGNDDGGSDRGAILFTNHDSAGAGSSFHFVGAAGSDNQGGNLHVTAPNLIARKRMAIGYNAIDTNYILKVNGATYLGGNTTLEGSSTLSRTGKSISWNQANTYAMIRMTSQAGWSPLLALKANTGWWTMGHYNANGYNDHLLFTFLADVDVSGVTNAKNHMDYLVRLIPTVYATNTTTTTERAFVTAPWANGVAAVGNTTTPIYINDAGVASAGNALKDLAYIAKPSSNTTTTFLRGDGSWQTVITAHRTYTAVTGKPTGNQTPGFGSTFTIQQINQSTTGQISATDRTVTIPNTEASISTTGLVNTGSQVFGGGKTLRFTSRIYPLIGVSNERSAWYKITFPYYNATTSGSAKWFMNSFDLHFGGGYSNNPSGVAHVTFYWTRAANNGAWALGQGAALIEGTLANKIILYYRVAEPGILYVQNTANVYNGIWIDNLYVDDTAPGLDWSTTTISTIAAITDSTDPALSAYTKLSTSYLYNDGGTLKTDNNFEGKYIKGTWLYTSAATAKTTTSKLATIESDNYIYYITPANALKSAIGTTSIGGTGTPIYWNGSSFQAGTALGASAYHADSYFALASHGNHVANFPSSNQKAVFLRGDNTWTNTLEGPLRIGTTDTTTATGYATASVGSQNYITFYGVYGDNPGSYNHTYIGESIYGSKTAANEQSELLLFKGNDVAASSGPDRIRLFAAQVDIQTYTSALSGTWDTIRGTTGTQIANFKNGQVTITGNILPEATGTRDLGSTSYVWNRLYTNILSTTNGDCRIRLVKNSLVTSNTNKVGTTTKLTSSDSDSEWLKALLKEICIQYPGESGIFRGIITPNSIGYYEVYIYSTSTVDSTTGLPQHSYGTFRHWSEAYQNFGTSGYNFFCHQFVYNTGSWGISITGSSASCTGNAATATKFNSTRKIELTGAVTGSATTDGSSGWTISTSVNHTHSYLPLSGGTISGDLGLKTASADSPDIVWWYGDTSKEQARIWMGSGGTTKWAPLYRCYKSDGTSLYNGNLVLGDGTGASGTWGISITGNAATASILQCPRLDSSANASVHPGKNIAKIEEFPYNGTNAPSEHWYYILSMQGNDTTYSTQLALGETVTALYYRTNTNNTFNSWTRIVTNSGTWGISVTGSSGSCTGNAATATTATNLSAAPTITATGTATVTLSANTAYTLTVGGKSVIFKTPVDNNTATAADNILDGSNSGTQVTYAPYTSQQAKLSFDTSTTAPSRTDRLNLNGSLYATTYNVAGNVTLQWNSTDSSLDFIFT